jgi:hypothetical protein
VIVLAPYADGRLRLRNRVAFAATVTNLGLNREISQAQVDFYAARARGGAGLVVTEGLAVHPSSIPNHTVPLAYEQALVPQLARVAAAVHAEGAVALGQLWHAGRQALWNPMHLPWSASAERDPYSGATPHAVTLPEIDELVAAFAATAGNLSAAGFDGVELHGAHGYLIGQFLSPWSNRRTDGYGGPVENRARLVVEVTRAVRAACGDAFVVGLKLSADEGVPGGLDLEATRELVAHIVREAPPDYVCVSQGNFSPSLEWHTPDLRFADAHFRHLWRGVREVSAGVPVMGVGKVPSVELAERLVAAGDADVVAMSRALLADPELVAKAARGGRSRPCVYCNVCWHQIHTLRPVACFYAPEAPESRARWVEAAPAASPSAGGEVHVVGAGPAGLEVARVAAARGHRVVVHEARGKAGGRIVSEATVPGRAPMAAAARWLADEAVAAGAELRLGEAVDAVVVDGWSRDATVVLAVGAVPVVTEVPGAEHVLPLEDAFASPVELGGRVALVDELDDEPVYAAAEALAGQGARVLLLSPRPVLGRHVPWVGMLGTLRRLDEAGVTVHLTTRPVRVQDGELVVAHTFSGRERTLGRIDAIVHAGPYRPAEPLATGGRRTIAVGDAVAPRSLLSVVHEAHRAGLEL